MKISEFVGWLVVGLALCLILAIFFGGNAFSEDKPKTAMTVQDLKLQDQAEVENLFKVSNEYTKDMELAQAKLELAQNKINRLNEVLLPAFIGRLRADYKLPVEEWNFDIKTFTFTKKEAPK